MADSEAASHYPRNLFPRLGAGGRGVGQGQMQKRRMILLSIIILLLTSCQPTSKTVTLALLGDLILGRGVNPAIDSLAYLAPELQAADLSLANLESPLAHTLPAGGTGFGYNLCAPAQNAELLRFWGVDLLSIANNHRFDCGSIGSSENETASLLTSAGTRSQSVPARSRFTGKSTA